MRVKNKGLVSRIYKDLKEIIIIINLTGQCASYMDRGDSQRRKVLIKKNLNMPTCVSCVSYISGGFFTH